MNKAHLYGRVGGEISVRAMQDGTKVANFSVATTESWKDKQTGEKKEKTQWHNIVIWGNGAKFAESYVRKGNRVFIEGAIETRSWEKDGEKKYTTEIVVKDFNGSITLVDWPEKNEAPAPQNDDIEDEIPF